MVFSASLRLCGFDDFCCNHSICYATIRQTQFTERCKMSADLPSILLVEDHEDTRNMLELLFEEWGYRATMASTATEGLKMLLQSSYDIIILDNWLPDLDGIELCRQIRAFNRKTPIIFYSAAVMGSEDRDAIACGASAYIYKGNGLGPLRQAMGDVLGKANSKQKKKSQ